MNYIELINHFWKIDLENSFTPLETTIYFRLVARCNSLGWKNPFNFPVNEMLYKLKLKTKDPFDSARNRLKQVNLIDFKNGNGRGITTIYKIIDIKKDIVKPPPLSTISPPLLPEKNQCNNKQKLNKINNNYIYHVGNEKILSVKDFLEANYNVKMPQMEKKYGKEFYKIALTEFSLHHNQKKWTDAEDLSQHFSSFIRILSEKYSQRKNNKSRSTKIPANSLKETLIESTKTILTDLENGQITDFEIYN